MTDWWPPREIYFTREQCIFIIVELVIGGIDTWPTNPAGSGYTDAQWSKKSKRRPGAYFETACQVRAEMEVRLERCGIAGKLLVSDIKVVTDKWWTMDWKDYLNEESKDVLEYVSGDERKEMPFLAWNRQRRYRNK